MASSSSACHRSHRSSEHLAGCEASAVGNGCHIKRPRFTQHTGHIMTPATEPATAQPIELASPKLVAAITQRLAEPFPLDQLGWLPKSKQPSNGQVRVVPYLEVGAVKRRLTHVLGLDGWEALCHPVNGPHAAVIVKLRVRLAGQWIEHSDVGAAKSKPNEPHQALQSAASNGLKRAAESLGVGAYLKRLGTLWMDWDASKERLREDRPPRLPAWALPANPASTPPQVLTHAVGALVQEFARCNSKDLFGLLRYSHRWLLRCGVSAEQQAAIAAAREATAKRMIINDTPEAIA
jgi:hypothetical protein